MQDNNKIVCDQCGSPTLRHFGQWPDGLCTSEAWHTMYTKLFSQNNWLLKTMGKRMRNIITMYSLSIAVVGVDARKIVDAIVTYYRVRYSPVRCSDDMNTKETLDARLRSLDTILKNQYPQKALILTLLRDIKKEGNLVAHKLCLTTTMGEEGKCKIITLLAQLMPLFMDELNNPADKRCVFYYYNANGCTNPNCRFPH